MGLEGKVESLQALENEARKKKLRRTVNREARFNRVPRKYAATRPTQRFHTSEQIKK